MGVIYPRYYHYRIYSPRGVYGVSRENFSLLKYCLKCFESDDVNVKKQVPGSRKYCFLFCMCDLTCHMMKKKGVTPYAPLGEYIRYYYYYTVFIKRLTCEGTSQSAAVIEYQNQVTSSMWQPSSAHHVSL
jgi:hypothetical protein